MHLFRTAILWHELWHEGLEEASRLFFGERDVAGMFETLEPLHEMMDKVSCKFKICMIKTKGAFPQSANRAKTPPPPFLIDCKCLFSIPNTFS